MDNNTIRLLIKVSLDKARLFTVSNIRKLLVLPVLIAFSLVIAGYKKHSLTTVYVFKNVNVIPMTSDTILQSQIVIVANGKISLISDSGKANIPAGAKVIDAKGKFLLPGFIDCYAHVHEKNLSLFAAKGITTVRNAPGVPFQHGIKIQTAKGKLFGPRIFSAGVPISGQYPAYHSQGIIASANDARFSVTETKRMGYDAVFVYTTITPEGYFAVLDEAKKQNIRVDGHLPYMVNYDEYTNGAQRSFDNLVGFINLQTGETYPKERLAQMSAGFKVQNKYIIPTLTIHKVRASASKTDSLKNRSIMKYVPPRQREYWHLSSTSYKYSGAPLLVKTFYENGVKLLLGSDAGFHFVVPAFSYFDEMLNFSELGISNYDILKAGTIDAAEYLGWQDKIGTIEAGKEADLILLDANPLENISNAIKLSGVMLKGVWYTSEKLNKKLTALEAELKEMPARNRLSLFKKPSPEYKLTAHYNIYFKDVLCGEEKIFTARNGKSTKILSQNSIDPICQRNTITEWLLQDGVTLSISVNRTSIEGASSIELKRSGKYYTVKGNIPFYGSTNFTDSLSEYSVLAGPNTSINIDMDIIANFQVSLNSIKNLEINQTDSVLVKKIELNPEEWGKHSVIGNSKYKVKRLPDDSSFIGLKKYEIIQPGFNGAPGYSFKAIVRINQSGFVEDIVFNNDVKVRRIN